MLKGSDVYILVWILEVWAFYIIKINLMILSQNSFLCAAKTIIQLWIYTLTTWLSHINTSAFLFPHFTWTNMSHTNPHSHKFTHIFSLLLSPHLSLPLSHGLYLSLKQTTKQARLSAWSLKGKTKSVFSPSFCLSIIYQHALHKACRGSEDKCVWGSFSIHQLNLLQILSSQQA